MKKFFSVGAAAVMAFAAVSGAAADTRKYFSPYELSGILDYMTGKDVSPENMDINADGTVNILDTILVKESINNDYSFYRHILSCADYDRDICSNEKLSSMASVIFNLIENHLQKNISDTEDKTIFKLSSDDGSELSQEINTELLNKYGYRNLKWMARYRQNYTLSVLCTVNEKNTGSYPSAIPDDVHIPYDESFLRDSLNYDFDWKAYYSSTSQLNEDAKLMVQYSRQLLQNAVEKGTITEEELTGDFIIDSRTLKGSYFESMKSTFRRLLFKYNTDWIISGKDGIPHCAVLTNLTGYTGAFPAAVPQSLDVPYSPELTEYANGNRKWSDDFAECISDDPERKDLPDYPEITDDDALLKAAALYNGIEWYISENEYIPEDGVYSSDDAFETIPEMMKYFRLRDAMTAFSHEHYLINVENGVIVSAEYINDSCEKKAFVDADIFRKYTDEHTTVSIKSPPIASKNIFTGSDVRYIPEPDYTLYYSTDEDNYNLSVLKYNNGKKDNPQSFEEKVETQLAAPENDRWNVIVTGVVTKQDSYTGGYGPKY